MSDLEDFIPFIRNFEVIKANKSSRLTDDSLFFIRYNAQRDRYESSSPQYCLDGWARLTYNSECIDHLHEEGHLFSFLNRHRGCPPEIDGLVHWRFDLSALGNWRRIELYFGGKEWTGATVDLRLVAQFCDYCSHKKVKKVPINKLYKFTLDGCQKRGIKYLDVIAKLGGGRRSEDDQHLRPQLFRTHDNDSEWLFSFTVY